MQDELDKFWSDITGGGGTDPSTQLPNKIHNPTFRYLQMILAQTFFGKGKTNDHVNAEEILMLFCTAQSHLIAIGNFLRDNLNLTARSSEGPIHVRGIMTHIAHALGPTTKISHMTAYCIHTLIDPYHYLERDLIRRIFFSIGSYKLLIDDEIIHYFGLPNPTRTSVHDKENWSYPLEAQDETPNPPKTPPVPEYHHTTLLKKTIVYSSNVHLQRHNIYSEFDTMHKEMISLRENLTDLTLQMETYDATHAAETDCLYQEIYSLRRQLAEAQASFPHMN